MPTPPSQTLSRALTLFAVILKDDGANPLEVLAERAGLPFSTAHRLVATLEREGMIQKAARGRYLAGPTMLEASRRLDEGRVIARLSRPLLAGLARKLRQTVHLGVLEDGMVTYLIKESFGSAATFTREGMQLEAYCSGIGKVLLAHLETDERERYLSEGPFVALTPNTLVEPEALGEALALIRSQGWGVDNAEVFETLKCVAAPLRRSDGSVLAAVSVSAPFGLEETVYEASREALLKCILGIETRFAQQDRRPEVAAMFAATAPCSGRRVIDPASDGRV